MKYVGSKNRHSKELLSIMLPLRKPDQVWVEPFVGGFNMIDKVSGSRIANDSHFYLIELFKAIRAGWSPPEVVTETLYKVIKDHHLIFMPQLVGFAGFGCSYSGKWFGGYARDGKGQRNYCRETRDNLLKQAPNIQNILITNQSYDTLSIPPNSLIYADPPYANTVQYKDKFDSDLFWLWAKKMHEQGHTVFVSEYVAPENWKSVWSKEVNNTLVQSTGSKQGIEHLFVHV